LLNEKNLEYGRGKRFTLTPNQWHLRGGIFTLRKPCRRRKERKRRRKLGCMKGRIKRDPMGGFQSLRPYKGKTLGDRATQEERRREIVYLKVLLSRTTKKTQTPERKGAPQEGTL